MKFSDAKNRLKEIAGEKYHTLIYEMSETRDGTINTQCSIYIDGENFYKGRTFKEAFRSRARNGAMILEEMPDHEV